MRSTFRWMTWLLWTAACGGSSGAPLETEAPAETQSTGGEASDASARAAIAAALSGTHRAEENRARDRYRHPQETLEFFGLRPDMTVLELSPGAGWYTEVLAPVLRERGKLIAAIPAPDGERARYAERFQALLQARPDLYDRVATVVLDTPGRIELGPDGSADMVLTFRNTHNWIQDGSERAVYEAVFRVLKPGGTFGVVQHRGVPGSDAHASAELGYVPEAYVIETARQAGFELVAQSEVNANPADTKDHPGGVWALPPVLKHGEQDRARYLAIGESDRMTLRFRKPAP